MSHKRQSFLIVSIVLITTMITIVISDEESNLQQRHKVKRLETPIARLLSANRSSSLSSSTTTPSTTSVIFDEKEEEEEMSSPYGKPDATRVVFNCGRNEVPSNCTNSCPASCEDPDKEPCRSKHYCWSGCECAPGYVKEHQNWTCIPKEQCPKCELNEHYRDCGSGCQPSCANYQNIPPYCSSKQCVRGCFCDFGYVRDESQNGKCVKVKDCPQKCGPNEYFEKTGPPCVRTHDNPRPKCLDTKAQPSCVCNTGFVRNLITKQCQPISLNFVEKCGGNETFSYCGSDCGRGCDDGLKRQFCLTICNRGCFCNDGYVRDNHNGQCVLPKDCYVWRPEPIEPVPVQIVP